METVIIVLENKAIDVNGVVLQKKIWYYKYYGMFIKRNFGFIQAL
jgi:hypothetical protein